MPTVEMTRHLYRFFPQLEHRSIKVAAGSVAEVLVAVNEIVPGFSDYLVDEQGALRRHVHIAINNSVIIDRERLREHVAEDDTLFIFQALSGG